MTFPKSKGALGRISSVGPEFDPLPEWVGPSTKLVHGARRPELNAGSVVEPIYQTSTFHYPSEYSEATRAGRGYLYTRNANPTQELAAERIRKLEEAQAARVFGSGMGAITTMFFSLLRPGDQIVAIEDLYGGTIDFLTGILTRFGVEVRWVSHREAQEPEKVVGPSTSLVHLETPTNPLLRVHDLKRWAEAADAVGALLVVDNTFATPVNQKPLALGADLVVHSGTKYLGGHSDLIAGVLAGPRELMERVDPHAVLGSVLDPFAAFLLDRGLKTLALRVERQNQNGRVVTESLAGHPKVKSVHYPGRGSPAEEAIARTQMRGRGGIVAVDLEGGAEASRRFLQHLRFVHVASSLGGVESLASVPRETSHRHLKETELRSRGIEDGLVRLSLGIEDTEDLVRDLTDALNAI